MDQQAGFTSNTQATKAPVRQLARLKRGLRRLSGKGDEPNDDIAYIAQSGAFDREYYLAQYPDVRSSGKDPLAHFVAHGAEERRNPSATFDTGYYLDHYPDVAASGMNPLRHFLQFGRGEGRRSTPTDMPSDNRDGKAASRQKKDLELICRSGLFNNEYYLSRYPDVAKAGMDPAEHFLEYGAVEGRKPCELFDAHYYLANNADVAASGINPLVHFCKYGWKELRDPSEEFNTAWHWLLFFAEHNERGNPLVFFIKKSGGQLPKPAGAVPPQDRRLLQEVTRKLLADHSQDAQLCSQIGLALAKLSYWAVAEEALRASVAADWSVAETHEFLARVLIKQARWWQAVDAMIAATELNPENTQWLQRLGELQLKMNRFDDAVETFRTVIQKGLCTKELYYHLGFALQSSGKEIESLEAYGLTIELDGRDLVRQCGIGIYHEKFERWIQAASAYAAMATNTPLHAELQYRLGMAHDRCYRWLNAEKCYSNAISLDPGVPYWHYRLGFVIERQGRWRDAAEAYRVATLVSSKHVAYWFYREGFCLSQAGEHEAACSAYSKYFGAVKPGTLPDNGVIEERAYLMRLSDTSRLHLEIERDRTCPIPYLQLGRQYEISGNWSDAVCAYRKALARSNEHQPEWFYRLGMTLSNAGRHVEACEAFCEMRQLRRPFGVNTAAYEKNAALKAVMHYNEYYECLPVRKDVVVYQSYGGASISGNPYAIFKYLLSDPDFSGWTHVWVINDRTEIPAALRALENVLLVRRDSDAYHRYLASASHLISNGTFPTWFIRRPEQRYLNTWHGTPLKTLGRDMKGRFLEHKTVTRTMLHATHMISPNEHTTAVLLDKHETSGIYPGRMAETGYPRIDLTLSLPAEEREEIRLRLGARSNQKVVLYAPTWRGAHGAVTFDVDRLLAEIAALGESGCCLVFRGHSLMEGLIHDLPINAIVAPQDIDTNILLGAVDILITDYSSVFFDFLPTRRPIIFYAYDLEEYADQRGLYFDMGEMPGRVCTSLQELTEELTSQLLQPRLDHRHEWALEKFCPHEDGHATKRVVDFFFRDCKELCVNLADCRRQVLIYAGEFLNNGITSSCLNLLRSIDPGTHNVSVVVEPDAIVSDQVRLAKLAELPDQVQVLARIGRMVLSPEEKWLIDRFNQHFDLESEAMWTIYKEAYRRDFVRTFGFAAFDAVVEFEGYVRFWVSKFAFGPPEQVFKSIFLHNDMLAEMQVRFPYLRGIFNLYSAYDRLLSVSRTMRDINANRLAEIVPMGADRFDYCDNTVDIAGIREKASQELDPDLVDWFAGGKVFLTIGRLSPEKDHSKLIRAFAEVHRIYPSARLIIVGDGPLKVELRRLVDELSLAHVVCLAGPRSNPFPLLRCCDCFVLSSNHEGQPMVLLEAMVLGRPIVATDIDGNRGVLGRSYGSLVENSAEGLANGMLSLLNDELVSTHFDAFGYQASAARMFVERALGEARSH